ncbi:MAG: PAS domain S-box protein, partial [Desulfobacteraceae bacterium]
MSLKNNKFSLKSNLRIGSILIVDDDQALCNTFKNILEKAHFKVHIAHTLYEAKHLFSFWKCDAVLIDIFLISENSWLLAQQSTNHQSEIPVIIMTQGSCVQTMPPSLPFDFYDYLQKPISSPKLIHALSRAVELTKLRNEKMRVETENKYYQRNLERLVKIKTTKLIESNKRYELLFSNSKDAIYVATPDGKFMTLNHAVTELSNCSKNILMQGKVQNLFYDFNIYQQFKAKIKSNGYVKDFEFLLKRNDGSVIECLLTANLIRGSKNEITGHQGIIRDITSQKQAEQKIREQNKFLTNILESLTYPFVVIDASDYSIKIANSAAVKSQILKGFTCHKQCQDKDYSCPHNRHTCTSKKVIVNGRPYHTEHVLFNQDGEQRKYEVHAFPLFNSSGQIVQVIQYYVDITEKKRLEAIAEAANLMDNLGYIFSGIRHEIGNPLNSVKLALSVLSKNLNNFDRKTIGEFIHRTLSELHRVEYLLKALKNFSLFESPVIESVSIRKFMHNFLSLVKDDFQKKQIRISTRIAPNAVRVNIDHRALHQILLNLMTNSADALVTCNLPKIDIVITHKSKWIKIQVIDNGCGISEEDMQNIFKPFVTSKPHGTGLVLVIV